MIPSMPVLQRLELISEGVPLGDRALRDAVDTVHLHGVQLTDTMPVNRCAIGIVVVFDMNDNIVTPTSFDQWAGEGLVEDFAAGLLEPVCFQLWEDKISIKGLQRLTGVGQRILHTVKSPETSSQYYYCCQRVKGHTSLFLDYLCLPRE